MRIAVTGPKGQLGSELVKKGCVPIHSNVNNVQGLSNVISEIKPDAIINCAAMTDVDSCENSLSGASLTNASGVAVLSSLFKGYIIQVSTDYIFDGHNGPYTTHARPNPLGVYGWSKLGGELAIKQHKAPYLIVRTTVLFSKTENNFVSKVVNRLKQGKVVELWQPRLSGTPTYVPALAAELIRMAKSEYTGLAHVTGNKLWTRLMFAQEIARVFGYDESLIVAREYTLDGAAQRPMNAGLICGHSGGLLVNTHSPIDGLKELAKSSVKTRKSRDL